MPIVASLMDNLLKQHDPKTAERIYYAMEAEGKGPFAPGGKYRHLHEAFAAKHNLRPSHAIRSRPKKKPAKPRKARRAR